MDIAVQLFGLGAMLSLFLSHQQKKRGPMLLFKMSADIFWAVHYALLGAMGGMVPNVVGTFRETVFFHRNTRRWANSRIWVGVFIAANLTLGILTFHAWYNVIPLIASCFVTVSLWLNNPDLTKIISAPVSAAYLVYDLLAGSYVGVLNESICILSIVIYFVKKFVEEKRHG